MRTPEAIIAHIARVSTKGLTVQQAALVLSRDPQFVYRQLKARKLKSYRIGKQHLIMHEDLLRFLEGAPNAD